MYLFLLCGILVVVNGWSTLDRTDKSYTTHKLAESPDYNYYKVAGKTFKECNDENVNLCKQYTAKYGYKKFCSIETAQKICKRTCGQCPAVSPLSCHASQLGCCWDNITKVSSGCPDCKDRSTSCPKIVNKCDQAHLARACPETCNICPSTCVDDPHQAPFCPDWKEYGMCEDERTLMGRYCAKTCNLCAQPELVVETVPEGKNKVVEVFRKGAESLFTQSDSQQIESEKELIKILLADKKAKRELGTENEDKTSHKIPKVINKKKELVADEILKIATETNDGNSIKSLQQQKKGLSVDSFNALVKMLSKEGKTKKETTAQDDAKMKRKAADDALFKLIVKDEMEKDKMKKEAGTSESFDDALFRIIKQDKKETKEKEVGKSGKTQQKKKSIEDEILEILAKEMKEMKKEKEIPKVTKEDAKKRALELVLDNLVEKNKQQKKEAADAERNAVDDALFDLIKERKLKETKKEEEKKKDTKEVDQAELLKKLFSKLD